jgi:hypothetical protein
LFQDLGVHTLGFAVGRRHQLQVQQALGQHLLFARQRHRLAFAQLFLQQIAIQLVVPLGRIAGRVIGNEPVVGVAPLVRILQAAIVARATQT